MSAAGPSAPPSRRRRPVRTLLLAGAVGAGLGALLAQPTEEDAWAPIPEVETEEAMVRFVGGQLPPAEGTPAPLAALEGMPAYPGARPEGLGRRVLALGTPMTAAFFATRDTPEQVVDYYEDRLASADLPVVSSEFENGIRYVGYRDHRTEEMHLVTVVPFGDHTMVFPSVGSGKEMLSPSSASMPETLPHPPEASDPLVFVIEEAEAVQHSVVASVPVGAVADLVETYRSGFEAKGWTVDSVVRPSPAEARLDARLGTSSAQTILRRRDGGAEGPVIQVVVMMNTRVGPA